MKDNAFVSVANPASLQAAADAIDPRRIQERRNEVLQAESANEILSYFDLHFPLLSPQCQVGVTYRKGFEEMNDQEMKNEGNTEPEPVPDTPYPAPQEDVNETQPSGSPVDEPLGEPAVALMEDMEEGKTFAILSYALGFIGLPFFIVPLIQRNNAFSLFHAKQCLVLYIIALAGSIVSWILMAVCIGFILWIMVLIFGLVLNIIGLMNALKGVAKPLPLIGQWGIDWFKGMTKV